MKPTLPKGTRDFSPEEMLRRNHIFGVIRKAYQRYGFQEIETPAMENLSTLEGKYGEEGDKLLYRILDSGPVIDRLKSISDPKIGDLSEKGLRYDLTVPFARFVVMNQHRLQLPFKRYQIQPVWRADRPQKGRYREFYQCDADIVGSDSLFNELELIRIIQDVFGEIKLGVVVKLNNRKILAGIAEVIGAHDNIIDITVAIDKLDKIGLEQVNAELSSKGLSESAIRLLQPVIALAGSNESKLESLRTLLKDSEIGMKGVAELDFLLSLLSRTVSTATNVEIDVTLARGLNYYTGSIIEVKISDERSAFSSSVCGGGRYDDLTGIFGLKGVSGVGISFGADRIYDVLEEVNGFPELSEDSTRILFVNFGEEEAVHCLKILARLRADGINAELYPDAAKMKKQLSYADAKKIRYAALVGTDEIATGRVSVKDLLKGEQTVVTVDELVHLLK
ncbi:MAG: histidine--tRNA ligase [Bacteroidota bacterium]